MDAFDVMTTSVIKVSPDASMQSIAELLLKHGISAVPVLDEGGELVGMVSEGDLLRFSEEDRENRRDWWLALLAEGETLNPDFLESLSERKRTAREIMSAPVVTVTEHTDVSEIGKLLATHQIKRVPVLRDGHLVGIVSRADLVRALTVQFPASSASWRLLTGPLITATIIGMRNPGGKRTPYHSPGRTPSHIGFPFLVKPLRLKAAEVKLPGGRPMAVWITRCRKPLNIILRTSTGGVF
jgi:CBS domain-containing protein